MVRIESPSSINTYIQCPRKYFYSYKLNLPRKESIATITGKAVHDTLEKFYILGSIGMNEENYIVEFQHRLLSTFNQTWTNAVPSLLNLQINKGYITRYYEDTMQMLMNFVSSVINKINQNLKEGMSFELAFEQLKPETEIYLSSDKYMVQGYIDALHENHGQVCIMDYKTSKKDVISEEYRRQLAIYSLLYSETFGKLPYTAGLFFLRQGTERVLNVDAALIEEAKSSCEKVHNSTVSGSIEDYPRKLGPLCKWATGQCDFYDICYKVGSTKEVDCNEIEVF